MPSLTAAGPGKHAGQVGGRSKHLFKLGDPVSFSRRYLKCGYIDLESDRRAVFHEDSGFTSIPKYEPQDLPKPRRGIVIGIRKITLVLRLISIENGEHPYYDHQKELESQVYIVATDLSHTHKVAEAWLTKLED